MKIAMPHFLKNLFWDINFDQLDPNEQSWFIIERVVNHGHSKQSEEWLVENYSADEIADNLVNNYNISTKKIYQWSRKFSINPEICKCMLRPSVLRVFD